MMTPGQKANAVVLYTLFGIAMFFLFLLILTLVFNPATWQ